MNPSGPRPPTLSRRLLEWAAARLETPDLAADAAELFAQRVRDEGEAAARRWYRIQARASLGRLLLALVDALRVARRPAWIAGLALDAKLGGRMLVKYPGVTLVGGMALAIGIGLGAGYLDVLNDVIRPKLPFPDGERIVGLRNWDVESNDPELRSVSDFLSWREALESVEDLGAFRTVERNLSPSGGPGQPTRGAQISASAFRVTGVPALLGRTLLEADERVGTPEVVVLGYHVWRNRLSADPAAIGSTVRLNGSARTVVGVMPEGFAFPMDHQYWTPLRPDALRSVGPRQGPPIRVFGRLTDEVGLEEAQAELTALGARAAARSPATHAHLQPQVVTYTALFLEDLTGAGGGGVAYLVEIFFVLLLLVLGSNVATMVFARTATRENEIVMRFALGASRAQIIAQLFFETLVLALAAVALGLAVVAWGAPWVTRFVWELTGGRSPFWLDTGLNLSTVVFAVGLAVFGSLVAGVVPALKATHSRVQPRLRQSAGATDSAMRFGGFWTAAIMLQVAFAVLVVPPAVIAIDTMVKPSHVEPGFEAAEYLSARIETDPDSPETGAAEGGEFAATLAELRRRLLAEPNISQLTFATRLPGMDHPNPWMEIDDEGPASSEPAHLVMTSSVDVDFLDAFGADIVAGRAFDSEDWRSERRAVVVNEDFVTEILQGRNAIGRRVRPLTREPGPWFEIVGVVSELGMDTNRDPFWSGRGPGMYRPLSLGALEAGTMSSIRVAFHVRGDAASSAPRLREIAHAVDPALRLYDVLPLDRPVDRANRSERVISRVTAWLTALFAAIALLASTAGTYSVMSFTVSRQTREIGIRVALGAERRRILKDVFSRAALQIGGGAAVGLLVGGAFWGYVAGVGAGLLVVGLAVVAVVGLIACGVPVRRALSIAPTEALKGAE